MLSSLDSFVSELQETILDMKEEIQTLNKVIELLANKVDRGLALAQGQPHCFQHL